MKAIPFFLFAAAVWAQPVYVYSEFVTIDATGKVAKPERPREILSPAIVRNAFASFQIVVDAPEDEPWWLHVGLNPEEAVKVTMYRQSAGKLEPVSLPIKGKGTDVFWMDLWTAAQSPTGRIKVEPQLNIDNDWMIYPMEVRVEDPRVPDISWKPQANAPGPRAVMRAFACGSAAPSALGEGLTPQSLRYRNALQDLALARTEKKEDIQAAFGPCTAPEPDNPESYYSVRDFLFKHILH